MRLSKSRMELTFREPVMARVRDQRGKPALLEIRDVRDGLAALNRYGLGSERCGTTNPLPRGLKGTKPIPSSSQVGSTEPTRPARDVRHPRHRIQL